MQPPPPRNIIFLPPLMQPNPRNITFFISHSRTLMSKKSEMMGTGNLTKTGPRVSCFFYPMVGWCTAHASFPFISKLQLYLSSFAVTLVQEKPQQKKINIARLQNCPGNTIGLEKSSHCYDFQPDPDHCYHKVQHCEYCPVPLLIVRSK